ETGLVAFDVVDMFSQDYMFYMFNIRLKKPHVPGASDLLLYEMIKMASNNGEAFAFMRAGNPPVTFLG
ncbi:MAG: hypothetical protein N2235_14005, partial [Fischerella sp.]|nr:hypothetical protein [Fischerella sp.]